MEIWKYGGQKLKSKFRQRKHPCAVACVCETAKKFLIRKMGFSDFLTHSRCRHVSTIIVRVFCENFLKKSKTAHFYERHEVKNWKSWLLFTESVLWRGFGLKMTATLCRTKLRSVFSKKFKKSLKNFQKCQFFAIVFDEKIFIRHQIKKTKRNFVLPVGAVILRPKSLKMENPLKSSSDFKLFLTP